MRSIRYLNTILTILTVLVGIHIWMLWMTGPNVLPAAKAAGIPDAGAQRMQIVQEIKALNKTATELKNLFVKGKARVTIIQISEEQDTGKDK